MQKNDTKVIQLNLDLTSFEKQQELSSKNNHILSDLGLNCWRKQTCAQTTQTETKSLDNDPWGLEEETPLNQELKFIPSFDLETQLSSDIDNFITNIHDLRIKQQPILDDLVNKITKIITTAIKGSNVMIYGSHATGLNLPNNDLDLLLKLPRNYNPLDVIKSLQQKFKDSRLFEDIRLIHNVATPLLKLRSTRDYQSKRVDITIQDSCHNGLACVSLINDLILSYDQLKPLVLVLKHFISHCRLSNPFQGGLSSYGLILMVASFLQMKPPSGTQSLGSLLLEFLYLYGLDMDYCGKTIKVHLPHETPEDQSIQIDAQNFAFTHMPTLVIVDPLNKLNNVGRPTYLVLNLKFAFVNALVQVLNNSPKKSPLRTFYESAINQALPSVAYDFYQPLIQTIRNNIL